jgi:hypothetical protein
MTDDDLKDVLTRVRTVAVVGLSANPLRASYFVARYLSLRGKAVIGVNPGLAGQALFGQTIRARLSDIPEPVDMVDVFRAPEAVPGIVDDVLGLVPVPSVLWLQIGITHPQAEARAREAGLTVIADRCPKIEYQRLFGELRMGGFNTGVVSSRL